MFKFFKNLFKKKKKYSKDDIKERLQTLGFKRGVDITKLEDNMYSIEIDPSETDITVVDIIKMLEGE